MSNNSIYVTLSKQVGLFKQMDVIANNIANKETAGFKNEDVIFENYMVNEFNAKKKLDFSQDVATSRNLSNGNIRITNRRFDLAIEGEGYFKIRTPLGDRYSRNGNFLLDENGNLITGDRYQILSADNEAINIPQESKDVKIGDNGIVIIDGDEASRIGIFKFDNPRLLEKMGNSLYKSSSQDAPGDNFRLIQGALEDSNVNSITELTKMIELQRSVGTTSNLIAAEDELLRSAARILSKTE